MIENKKRSGEGEEELEEKKTNARQKFCSQKEKTGQIFPY